MSTVAQIEQLNAELATLSSSLDDTKSYAKKTRSKLWISRLKTTYFEFAKALRKPQKNFSLWYGGLLIVVPFMAACLGFATFYTFGLSRFDIGVLSVAVSILAFLATILLLTAPATRALPGLIAQEKANGEMLSAKLKLLESEATLLKTKIDSIQDAIQQLHDSSRLRRELLLQQNWKAMKAGIWESYLAEVFETLGAQVELTPNNDQGVDLLVRFGEMNIAIQAKGYSGAVGNKAIQEVVAGKIHYGCNRAAVITNSSFTRSAQELAKSTSCILIGETDFPAFVMSSNLELFK